MPVWLGAVVGVAALLAAAKAHGRQVRLEREAAGYHHVEFGGQNPEFVEKLWRRDRIRFWGVVPAAALAFAATAWLATEAWSLTLLAALLWAPIAGFFLAGLRSYASQRGRGGVGWWALAGFLSASSVAAALL